MLDYNISHAYTVRATPTGAADYLLLFLCKFFALHGDLLTEKADNGGSGYAKGATVQFTFRHALLMVQVSISGGKG